MDLELLKYAAIPFIAAFVGWGTNWLALKMTFYPVEYWGIRPFGWQGIIPVKSPKIARKVIEMLTHKLLNVEELFDRIDPHRVAVEMTPTLDKLAPSIISRTLKEHLPVAWALTSEKKRMQIYEEGKQRFPVIVEEVMNDIKSNFHELVDLDEMIYEKLTEDKRLLNEIFLKCGTEEFKFIERSGAYFGFAFGIIQMLVWYFYPQWWILPLGGLIVGYATNMLALKMIFRPMYPVKIGFWTIQGLFMKRQAEVAEEYGKIVSERILTGPNIFGSVLNSPAYAKMVDITIDYLDDEIDRAAGFGKTLVKITAGTKKYTAVKSTICRRLVAIFPNSIDDLMEYAEEAIAVEEVVQEKMLALPLEDYEDTLRPVFKEEEWILILIGALLGMAAGFMQLVLLF